MEDSSPLWGVPSLSRWPWVVRDILEEMDSVSSNLPWVLLQFLMKFLALMINCYLELLAEINSFLSKLFLLRLFIIATGSKPRQ